MVYTILGFIAALSSWKYNWNRPLGERVFRAFVAWLIWPLYLCAIAILWLDDFKRQFALRSAFLAQQQSQLPSSKTASS
jgi:hypothetical protein